MKITATREKKLRTTAKGYPLMKAMIVAEYVAAHGGMTDKFTFQEREKAFARLFLFVRDFDVMCGLIEAHANGNNCTRESKKLPENLKRHFDTMVLHIDNEWGDV